MNLTWYLKRLRKMSLAEILKRLGEHLGIYYSQLKYRDPGQWPYSRFAGDDIILELHSLPGIAVHNDWKHYRVYNTEIDLTRPLDWHFSDKASSQWPAHHYAKLSYRPGNPYGDVRINWELNRLQFLPTMAFTDEDLAKSILTDWLTKNPYLNGPGYLASMEVALRWLSIYWAACLFKQPPDKSLRQSLAGLAVASGKFIESRLSTHSSAGNHLIVEAVGLFWLGKALEKHQLGTRWIIRARNILWEQICTQIHPDGSNHEQSFWYIGFVLDALCHYFLLEERERIPAKVWERIEKMLEFIDHMILPDGSFPDYGDRDDGFVFRINSTYDESPFPGLLNIGSVFFDRPEWYRDGQQTGKHLTFWTGKTNQDLGARFYGNNKKVFSEKPMLKTYKDGGMSLMQWGKGRLLFRHSRLGLGNTCGHGHADALSILFFWNNVPVLIDLGSGQYNGDQAIRDFFRSTIAHNTFEIGGKNQAKILGTFLWDKSYETTLKTTGESPFLFAEAMHNGYQKEFGVIHTRRVEWIEPNCVELHDSFSGPDEIALKGAFHLGTCQTVVLKENVIKADFGGFLFFITIPPEFNVEIFHGSKHPFMGWRSTVYGKWEPIYSIVFNSKLKSNYRISLGITEK